MARSPSSTGLPRCASAKSRTTGGPSPQRQLPAWKSPCTTVSGRPQSVSISHRTCRPSRGTQFGGTQFGADRAVEQVTDGGGQNLGAPVREAVRRPVDARLGGGQPPHGLRHDLRGRVPAVRAGNVGQQQASRRAGQHGRHQVRIDRRRSRRSRSVRPRRTAGMALSQTGPSTVGRRNSPARFQVLRCAGRPTTSTYRDAHAQEFCDARCPRPGHPQRVVLVLDERRPVRVPGGRSASAW